jgi:hypothetical protein
MWIPRWFLVVNGVTMGLLGLVSPFAVGWLAWATFQLIEIGVKVERFVVTESALTQHLGDTPAHGAEVGPLRERVLSLERELERLDPLRHPPPPR